MTVNASNYNSSKGTGENSCPLPQSTLCKLQILSDWEILNSTNAERLRHRLQGINTFTAQQIAQACSLLESYHLVYRCELMQLRYQGYFGRCPQPNLEQLYRIAENFNKRENQNFSALGVLIRLKELAWRLRQLSTPQG